MFCLAVGLQQGMVWFVPRYAVTLRKKMVSKNIPGGIRTQEVNQIISDVSTNMIVTVLVFRVP